MKRIRLLALILLLGMSSASLCICQDVGASQEAADPSFDELLKQGQAELDAHHDKEAIGLFSRANRMKSNTCEPCYWGMAQAYFALNMFDSAIENCDQLLKYASDDYARAQAHNLKGTALTQWADLRKDDPAAAEDEFRAALKLTPNPPMPILHFNLGMLLLKENREAEGIAELEAYFTVAPQGESAAKARQLVDATRRRPVFSIPDFSIRTLQGDLLTRADVSGKVVLFDFWATWCGPCRAALPGLQRIYRRFSPTGHFVLLSISSDTQEKHWREFIAAAGMPWPQYLDRGLRLNRDFNIHGIPTYILVNPDGSVRRRFSGWGPRQDQLIEDEIDVSLETASKK